MYTYCILNDKGEILGLGSKEEAVMQAFNWYIDDNRRLHAKVMWFSDFIVNNFSSIYSDSEIVEKSIAILISRANEWRLTVYKSLKQ